MDPINTCPVANGIGSQMMMNLVSLLMASQCFLNENPYPADYGPNLKDGDTYDFIVVGAGSAGSVVSSRLSEKKDWKVLLIEAGDYPSPATLIPSAYPTLQNTQEDWSYLTEKSDHACLGFSDQRCRWPQGKVLGGSSAINGMLYLRGNKRDYDTWALNGNSGWDYLSVLPYFLKSENLQAPELLLSHLHSCFGNLTTTKCEQFHPFMTYMRVAAQALGYKYFNDEVNLGYFTSLSTIENGTRCSASKAFLSKIGKRDNLHLALKAQVGKLLFSPNLKNSTGVEVRIGGKTIKLNAKKEVILSAGTVNSPQILMNSGIGPQEHLQQVGIPLVKDLRVGENLQDHIGFLGHFTAIQDSLLSKENLQDDLYAYFAKRKGSFATTSTFSFVGLVNTLYDSPFPDIQMYHSITRKSDQRALNLIAKSLGYNEEVRKGFASLLEETNVLGTVPVVCKPKSRGKILLAGKDLYQKPLIYPNYLSDEWNEDVNTLLRGIDFINKMMDSPILKPFGTDVEKPRLSACNNFTLNSAFYACAVRHLATSMNNPVGTCKMGPISDKTSVVDCRLKVHGVERLRVIDASIMPTIISVGTNAAAIMIGEKGADMIKQDWYEDER